MHQVGPEIRALMAPHVVTLLHYGVPFQSAKAKLAEQLVMWARAHSKNDSLACALLGIGLRSVSAQSRIRCFTDVPAQAMAAIVAIADALMSRHFTYDTSLRTLEAQMVRVKVEQQHGNRARAARELGLHVNTVRNVLRAERNGH